MWGNPKLITWDYNKDATVTLEDALLSFESARFMLGGKIRHASATEKVTVNLNEEVVIETKDVLPKVKNHLTSNEYKTQPSAEKGFKYINLTKGTRGQVDKGGALTGLFDEKDHVRIFWTQEVENTGKDEAAEIVISPDVFPGTSEIFMCS